MPSKLSPDLTAYLDSFPAATRKILDKIRATVHKAVPDAEEKRSYDVGAFKRGGTYVLYYAGYAKHVAIYPVYVNEPELAEDIKPYASGKATVQFKLSEPIPYGLIAKIVAAKVVEHQGRVEKRAATRRDKAGKVARATLAKKPVAKGKDAAKTPTKKKVAKTNPVKKTVKKSAAKTSAKAPANNPLDVQNLSWALLKPSVAAEGVGKVAKIPVKKSARKKA